MLIKIHSIAKNNNVLSLLGNLVVAVFGFLSFFILARSFSLDDMGEWVLFITAGNFMEMMRFGITRTAIIRFLSGAKPEERQRLIASNWVIGFYSTAIISAIIWLSYLPFTNAIANSGFKLFFVWYPLLSFLNLPFNNAISILSADQEFKKILNIRLVNNGLFVLFLMANAFWFKWGVIEVLYAYLIVNVLSSIICMIKRWDGFHLIKKANRATNKIILDFGKFTIGTLIGSNLLKSADTFIIGLSPILGKEGVALFSVPLKLTEILEIPLRSFAATAFPNMSKASIQNNISEVKRFFYSYSGSITYLFIPIAIISFIFAKEFVIILGGQKYIAATDVFRMFCIYGLLIPIDRFTGVALDSINKPRQNFYKVIFMALANIIGDLIAIFVIPVFFPQINHTLILMFVALATIVMTLIGLIVGFNYLNKEINVKYKEVFAEGWKFYHILFSKFR